MKLACPKCHQKLSRKDNSYVCPDNHTYDIAKRNYINFLLNPDKAHNNPGDSKESLLARKAYLNQGYYQGILNQLIKTIRPLQPQELLDLGCGEGYYTNGLKRAFPETTVYGLDISKTAINMATRYNKDIYWLVGNSKNIPLLTASIDVVTALFTVVKDYELKRILKDRGKVIHVTANPQHLIEIKNLIYDEIKIKDDRYLKLNFPIIKSFDYRETLNLNNQEAILNLLKMTPHYYHIKKEKRPILASLSSLTITIDIKITIYENR